ncbi:MAG: GNAT family N-acetyltransferase [Mucilaginibacter sp.]
MQSNSAPILTEVTELSFSAINQMLDESGRAGYQFIQRTIDDWQNQTNKFSGRGEKLWGLFLGSDMIGICGLNKDPYSREPNIGRVRHLYIMEAYRRKGYATLLINMILHEGKQHFNSLRLFTDNPAAAKFYEKLGFQSVNDDKVSHIFNF